MQKAAYEKAVKALGFVRRASSAWIALRESLPSSPTRAIVRRGGMVGEVDGWPPPAPPGMAANGRGVEGLWKGAARRRLGAVKLEPCEDWRPGGLALLLSGVHGALVGLGMCGIVRAAVGRVGESMGVIL